MQIVLYILLIIYHYQTLPILGLLASLNLVALFGIVMISVYYILKLFFKTSFSIPVFVKVLMVILISFIVYFIFSPNESMGISKVDIVKNVFVANIPFFPFYYWSKSKELSLPYLKFFVLTLISLNILMFFFNQAVTMNLFGHESITNNIGYAFVVLLPLAVLLFWKNKAVLLIILFVIISFALMSLKRGCIIIAIFDIFILGYYYLKTGSKSYLSRNIIVLIIVVFIGSYYMYDYFQTNEYLQIRLQNTLEGDSSGRDDIYSTIYNSWFQTQNVFYIVFGAGINQSVRVVGTYAHNDWLELLSSMGLFGVALYAILIYNIYRLRTFCNTINEKAAIVIVIYSWIAITIFSMMFYEGGRYPYMIVIAIVLSGNYKQIMNK